MPDSGHRKMLELKGLELPALEFSLSKLGDFLFWEGPLMSHFVNDRGEDFIFKWSDKDNRHNRWMVYKTTPSLLLGYFNGRLNSLDLILSNPDGFVYFIEMDNDLAHRRITLLKNQDIPGQYLPLPDSFYETETYEPYTEKLRAYLDLHFARQRGIYKPSDVPAAFAAEPPPPGYGKK